jgi:glutathione S-transferase
MPAALWSIKYSPWSVRVTWALKLLKFDFTVLPYPTVFLSEWRLRFRLRRWRVSVPVLVDNKAIMEGMEIVTHAQAQKGAEGPKLVRQGVEEWVGIADEVMENERCVRTSFCICVYFVYFPSC